MTPQEIKEECEKIWNAPGVRFADRATGWQHGYSDGVYSFPGKASGEYLSKEARKWRRQFAMYNKSLAPVVLATAEQITRDGELTHYRFKSEAKRPAQPITESAYDKWMRLTGRL